MQLTLRIADPGDEIAKKFDPEQAVRSYYQLAPFHKEFGLKPRSANS